MPELIEGTLSRRTAPGKLRLFSLPSGLAWELACGFPSLCFLGGQPPGYGDGDIATLLVKALGDTQAWPSRVSDGIRIQPSSSDCK